MNHMTRNEVMDFIKDQLADIDEWHSFELSGELFDCNIYYNQDTEELGLDIYATKTDADGNVITITDPNDPDFMCIKVDGR